MNGLKEKTFNQTWAESFMNYAVDIAKIYKNNPEQIINCLKFESVHSSLNETYMLLVKQGELKMIEDLEQGEKLDLWNRAKELSHEKNKCIMISRCIYLLEQLTIFQL
jgi:hypothetical protein